MSSPEFEKYQLLYQKFPRHIADQIFRSYYRRCTPIPWNIKNSILYAYYSSGREIVPPHTFLISDDVMTPPPPSVEEEIPTILGDLFLRGRHFRMDLAPELTLLQNLFRVAPSLRSPVTHITKFIEYE